jgi:DNA-directed RNA polymerase subunit D
MKAEIVEGWPQENAIRILLSETDASQVNAIRRALISDVPKLAISRVNITQGVVESEGQILESVNVLPDEVLAHRLAMLPIPTFSDDGVSFVEECEECMFKAESEKGCQQCQIIYSLNVQGPANDSEEEYITVYAGDLTTVSDQKYDILEIHKRIPLTILSKGQYLELYALARMGRGDSHQKWAPVAGVGFRQQQKAVLNKPKKAEVLFNLGLKTSGGKDINAKLFGSKKVVDNINDTIDIEKALHQVGAGTGRDTDFDNAITMEIVEGSYVFSYESDGSYDPKTVFNLAMDELQSRFENITVELEKALV